MNHKILIIDDEAAVREILRVFLTKIGYQAVTVESGLKAIEKTKSEIFSLVLCDVIMPGMDGLQVLDEIKQINPALPVLIMSGAATHDLVVKAMEKGAVDFVAKPLSLLQTNNIIRKILSPEQKTTLEYPSPISRLMREGYFGVLKMMNHLLEMKNTYLKGHSERVADYAVKIAGAAKLPESVVEVINYASLLHDIGKIGISDMILSKPDKLDSDEWADIKIHPILSRTMVEQLRLFRAEEPLIEYHHEWYDGSGYPRGLKNNDIPLGARIISIADAYDAITSDRPYRSALGKNKAVQVLNKYSGTQFDPKLTSVFLDMLNAG